MLPVAPEILPALDKLDVPLRHWYDNPVAGVAATMKLTVVPEQTVCEVSGWVVIVIA